MRGVNHLSSVNMVNKGSVNHRSEWNNIKYSHPGESCSVFVLF